MGGITDITTIVQHEVAEYAAESPNSTAFYVENPAEQVFAVLVVPHQHPQKSTIMVMARIEGESVVIETDKTDRPLSEALIHAGIPEQQIKLAYLSPLVHY